jgi:predicted nucleic acid-binding protein
VDIVVNARVDSDLKFIEVAVGALADALVTGNLRHFPARQRHGVRVLNPPQWLEFWAGTLR